MNKYIAEFLGTMFFLYIILAVGKPIAIGLALVAAIMMVGNISGAHLNPAVSVMMVLAGRLSMKELAPYVLAQIAGGVVALELSKRI
jgi:aquaporin Z